MIPTITWNYRPPGHRPGGYGLAYELIPLYRDTAHRAEMRPALLRGSPRRPRPHDGLADQLIRFGEDALAGCLRAEITPARLQQADYYCVARVSARPRGKTRPERLIIEVESGYHPRVCGVGEGPLTLVHDQDLEDAVTRVTDRQETAVAVAAALSHPFLGQLIHQGPACEAMNWAFVFKGHAGGDGPNDGFWWQGGVAP